MFTNHKNSKCNNNLKYTLKIHKCVKWLSQKLEIGLRDCWELMKHARRFWDHWIMNPFCRRCIVITSRSITFLFLHLLYGHLILPPLISLGLDNA